MVSEQIEESLRREIQAYVESRLSGIKQEISQLQTQLNETLKHVLESEGEAQWDGSLAATIAEHLRAAHERGIELAASESSRTQASSDMAIVKAAIEEIEGRKSQAEILKALVNRSSSFAPRVVFFVIKGDQVRGWRARGLQGSVGDETVQQIAFPLLAATMIGEVAKTRTTWSGTANAHEDDHLLLSRLSEETPQRIVAVPLVVRGRAVAVLYADSAGLDSDAINLEAIETLVRVAGMAVGLLSVAQTPAVKPPVEQPAVAEPVTETAEQAIPEAIPEAIYTPVRVYDEPSPAEAVVEPEPAIVERPAVIATPVEPFATPEPEPHAFADTSASSVAEAAPVDTFTPPPPPLAEPASTTSAPRRRQGSYAAELPVEVADEEEKRQHNDARRFARLLVSEIKLYNEQKVAEGRAEGNLYLRLREYVDRSREMYDKRVKPGVTEKYDYFHHELVNTLAEGDISKLGAEYPGAAVSA